MPSALHLGVRVHDRVHNRMFNDRFNRNFELAPGERRNLRIPLEDIRHGAAQTGSWIWRISRTSRCFEAKAAGFAPAAVYSHAAGVDACR